MNWGMLVNLLCGLVGSSYINFQDFWWFSKLHVSWWLKLYHTNLESWRSSFFHVHLVIDSQRNMLLLIQNFRCGWFLTLTFDAYYVKKVLLSYYGKWWIKWKLKITFIYLLLIRRKTNEVVDIIMPTS